MYEILCYDCYENNCGECREAMRTRYSKHLAHSKFSGSEKSSVAGSPRFKIAIDMRI